jgi:hypothetical protein
MPLSILHRALIVPSIALCFAGCLVSSLHPIYDDDSIVFDEALVGTWANRESEVTVAVTRGEWKSYHIAYTDRFGTTRFTGHLTTLGNVRFLNVRPEDGIERSAFLLVTNGILQVEIDPARVRVRELDHATVLKGLRAGTLKVAAATDVRQNVLITAGTAAVRTWLAAALKTSGWFAEWKTLTRSGR